MKKNFKKAILLVLAMVMIIASFAGCGEKEVAEKVAEGEMPKKLTVWASLGSLAAQAGAEDRGDILAYQLVEEATGVEVEWISPSEIAQQEQFNLLIASGEYPDVINYFWGSIDGGAQQYVDDGVIVPISDYLDFMPNLTKFKEERPDIVKQMTDAQDNILYLPTLRKDDELTVFVGPAIRQDWLDKLGLEMPTNTDELYDVLKAFKTQDPNGNGQADEIPFTGMLAEYPAFGIGNILWAFGTHYDFYVKDGKVVFGFMEDEMKEGLTYLNKLYDEGLLDPDYLINDQEKYDSKIMNDKSGFYYAIQPSKYYNNMNDGTRHIVGVPYFDGKCYNTMYSSNLGGAGAAITTANENPSGTAKWLDFFYSEEGTIIANFGKEGMTYNIEDGKYVLDREYVFNNPDGLERKNVCAMSFIGATTDFTGFQLWDYYNQTLEPWGKDAIEVWHNSADRTGILPALSFTPDENRVLSKYMNDIKTYAVELLNNIIVGRAEVDELEKGKEMLTKMNIEEVLKVYNDAYARFIK